MDADVGALSGGFKVRVGLARMLVMQPDVLLLDEPTNHLDLATKEMLIRALAGYAEYVVASGHEAPGMRS